jgi:D-serine deaminase-like pyridoxal phosphate-dependent protein
MNHPAREAAGPAGVHADGRLIEASLLETPAGVVDLGGARRNAEAVIARLRAHSLAWRPHVKTHKSRTLARIQLEAGAVGLTVATLKEAEAMAPLGADLLLAHPPVGRARQARLSRFLERHALGVALDSPEALDTVGAAARDAGSEVPVLVEIDVGMGRVGIGDSGAVVEMAGRVAGSPNVRFAGILFYPGHVRGRVDAQGPALAAVGDRLARTLDDLEAAGLPAEIVSGGSTPTLPRSHEIPRVTEIRAGTCIFHDRDMVALGVCTPDEVAYRVLATVVSVAVPGQAVIDAGSKALAREELRAGGGGYGVVHGRPEVIVGSVSEEHGILDLSGSEWRPRVGDRVEIVPNHVCVSVNLQDRLLAAEAGGYRPVPLEGRGRLP